MAVSAVAPGAAQTASETGISASPQDPLVKRKRRHPALSRSLGEASRGVQMKIEKDSVIDPEHIVVAASVTIGCNVKLGMVRADQFTDDGVSLIPLEPFSADAPSGCWSAR
jgi:hypothetical protein